jgi:hypothetical protein
MLRQTYVVGLCSVLTIALVLESQEVSAQVCISQAPPPPYLLTSDTVDWAIQVASGKGCVRGLRRRDIVLEKVTLTAPPKSGSVRLVGPGFRYTANPGFHGEDSFNVEVSGLAGKVRGTSTIRIVVSVKE